MNDQQIEEALRALALTVVRSEIVMEDFLVEHKHGSRAACLVVGVPEHVANG